MDQGQPPDSVRRHVSAQLRLPHAHRQRPGHQQLAGLPESRRPTSTSATSPIPLGSALPASRPTSTPITRTSWASSASRSWSTHAPARTWHLGRSAPAPRRASSRLTTSTCRTPGTCKPSVTLTYGLSYKLEMPPYELNGKQVSLVVPGWLTRSSRQDYLTRARKPRWPDRSTSRFWLRHHQQRRSRPQVSVRSLLRRHHARASRSPGIRSSTTASSANCSANNAP